MLFLVGKRIAAGIRRMDARAGSNWRSRINKKLLNIADAERCITAQVFGDYKTGCLELGLDPTSDGPARFGFNIFDADSPTAKKEFEALNRGWILVLEGLDIKEIEQLEIAA